MLRGTVIRDGCPAIVLGGDAERAAALRLERCVLERSRSRAIEVAAGGDLAWVGSAVVGVIGRDGVGVAVQPGAFARLRGGVIARTEGLAVDAVESGACERFASCVYEDVYRRSNGSLAVERGVEVRMVSVPVSPTDDTVAR